MTKLPGTLRFHHIGVACRSIAFERRGWEILGYRQEGEPFSDPLQGISGLFMSGPGPRMELLEPLSGAETLSPFLKAGIKMYHQAYETHDLKADMETLRNMRAKVVSPPKPAIAFNGRHVTFLILPNSLIIELIEMA